MSWTHARWLVPLGTILTAASCSLVNAFDDVAQVQVASGGSAGDVGSGGDGGEGTGGGGGEGNTVAPPGLVVVGGEEDGTTPVLLALSPQTGEELARIEGTYAAAVHESERDLWFLIQGDSVRAARFDRVRNVWQFESQAASIVAPLDPLHVFALNGNLAVLDAGLELQVFDTSDLTDITLKGSATYPQGLWGAVGVPNSVGGEVYVAALECPGDVNPCVVQITRIQIGEDVQQQAPADVFVTPTTVRGTEHGAIAFDQGLGQLAAVVPSFDEVGEQSTIHLRTRALMDAGSVTLVQRSPQPRVAVVDPCQTVIYVMGPLNQVMVAGSLNDDADRTEMIREVGVNGQGMVLEPYTRSLILQQSSGDNFTVDAWSITGTELSPNVRKRLNDWQPPSIQPSFVSVATPRGLVCD